MLHIGSSVRRLAPWTGVRLLALLVAALGLYGVVSGAIDLLKGAVPEPMRRLEPSQTLAGLVHDYPGNFATVVIFSLFMVVLAVHFFALLRDLYRYAPLAALLGGLFLGGSVLFGLALGLTTLKVNEFALQLVAGEGQQQPWFTPDQEVWLRGGINFLNQLHLIFVSGWFLCTGLGWMFVGSGALRGRAGPRATGVAELLAGLAVVASVVVRAWMPMVAGDASGWSLLQSSLMADGMALGLLASGILGWRLAAQKKCV